MPAPEIRPHSGGVNLPSFTRLRGGGIGGLPIDSHDVASKFVWQPLGLDLSLWKCKGLAWPLAFLTMWAMKKIGCLGLGYIWDYTTYLYIWWLITLNPYKYPQINQPFVHGMSVGTPVFFVKSWNLRAPCKLTASTVANSFSIERLRGNGCVMKAAPCEWCFGSV